MSALAQRRPGPDASAVPGEDQLRQSHALEAQKMEAIGRLVSGVAHDFNNLLTGIVLCSDLLLAGLEKGSRLRRYANEIRTAGAHGADLIQQLTAMARPQATALEPLSFNDAVRGFLSLLTRLIGENIELTTELAPDLALLSMDPAQAQQIVLNLVLNARDAMPDGGRIKLVARNGADSGCGVARSSPDACVEFEVQDTGCGMDADVRARVFEPFFTTKKPGKGNGLGLATVHGIVRREGG